LIQQCQLDRTSHGYQTVLSKVKFDIFVTVVRSAKALNPQKWEERTSEIDNHQFFQRGGCFLYACYTSSRSATVICVSWGFAVPFYIYTNGTRLWRTSEIQTESVPGSCSAYEVDSN